MKTKIKEKLEMFFALLGIVVVSFFLTLLPLIGTFIAGAVAGVLVNPEYEASEKKSKKIYFSSLFLGAAEIGIILAISCIRQTIDMGWAINIPFMLVAIPGYIIGYHFTKTKKTEVDEEKTTLA